ncbi:MAG: MscL family protein, partial [Planctomycetaceae bacterium]|nr:MscL family protein [Planctomycetaceae bacterium]
IKYGQFLQTTFDFLIVAGCIFLVVKAMNAMQKKEETAPPPPPVTSQEKLLAEIRDLLKKLAD